MAEANDQNTNESTGGNEVKPLIQEGAASQLELDVKPKPQGNATNVKYFKNKNLIKDIVSTPKEKPGGETSEPGSNNSSSSSSGPSSSVPKEDLKDIQARLAKEEQEYEGETPTVDDCKDTADMFVDILDFIMVFLAQTFALDQNDKEYQVDTNNKNKLKKHLAKYLARMNKKYPIGFMLVLTAIACYFPVFRRAHAHRKMVKEERAKKKATVISSDPNNTKKKRRRRFEEDDSSNSNKRDDSDDDAQYVEAEVVS